MGMTITHMMQPDDYSGGRIERVDLDTGEVTVLYTECDGHPLMGPNDLVFDADGGMWFTDHGKIRERDRDQGGVYYAAPDGSSIREVIYPLESPNGIGLSPEGDRLYVAETHTGRVYWWPVEGPGVVGQPSPVGHGGALLAGLPGMQLLDSLGVDGGGQRRGRHARQRRAHRDRSRRRRRGTTVSSTSPLPDLLVTNVCFGGDDLSTAFVTCSGTGKLVSMPWPRPGPRARVLSGAGPGSDASGVGGRYRPRPPIGRGVQTCRDRCRE